MKSHIIMDSVSFESQTDVAKKAVFDALKTWQPETPSSDGLRVFSKEVTNETDVLKGFTPVIAKLGRQPVVGLTDNGSVLNLVGGNAANDIYETWLKHHPATMVSLPEPTGPPTTDAAPTAPHLPRPPTSIGPTSPVVACDSHSCSCETNTFNRLWRSLDEATERDLAAEYIRTHIADMSLRHRAESMQIAPDVVLNDDLNFGTADADDELQALKMKWWRARCGIPDVEADERTAVQSGVETDLLREVVRGLQKWRSLAGWAPWFLLGTLIFSAALSGFGMWATYQGSISALDLSVLIFVLALFAISPAVLLLLERPLAGLDNWKPGSSDSKAPQDPTK